MDNTTNVKNLDEFAIKDSVENIIAVKNLDELYAIENPVENTKAYVKNNGEIYYYQEGWRNLQPKEELNLYDLNKIIINQLSPLTVNDINNKLEVLTQYHNQAQSKHHMLLGKEYNYYTIFESDPMLSMPDFASAVATIIHELGYVYSIESLNDGAVEIWIKPFEEDLPMVFYLFPYDRGVVYYG